MYNPTDFDKCIISPFLKGLLSKNRVFKDFVPEPPAPTNPDEEAKPYEVQEIENIIRYIIMIHDPESPLVKREKDLNRRKEIAAHLAGLPTNEEYLKTVYSCEHPLVVPLTMCYLQKFTKSMEWAAMVAFEHSFWEGVNKIMSPLESVEKKSRYKEEIDKDIERLEVYRKNFYADDEELGHQVKIRMTPERAAKLKVS